MGTERPDSGQAWHFVDADATLGPYGLSLLPAGVDGSAASLLQKMDELGIAEACVTSAFAMEYAMMDGNRRLLDEIAPYSRLHAVWVVAAHHTGEFPHPSLLLPQLVAQQVRMVRLILHAGEGYLGCFDPLLYEELLAMLAAQCVPLHLDYHVFAQQDARDLRDALRAWPSLPVVITIPKQVAEMRALYYLWEQFDNLHLTLSGYQTLGGIEDVVTHFGARVLLYGSRFPYFTPLQSMLHVIYSEISEEDKRRIAGENLLGLLRHAFPVKEA